MKEPSAHRDFLRQIIDRHLSAGTYGGRVVTRFPPEPNGYLHIGHAKSICLNFGLAAEFGGLCNLRMDDTNPTTESVEYAESIQFDVRWLGFEWSGFFHAADYFERLYQFAEELVLQGHAYVCDLSEAEMREWRGTISEPGRPSPGRARTPAENLALLRRMRAGEFADGARTLRAKIDMSAANMKMRDPPLYRIRRARHFRTGDAWCLYPLYDFAHCLSDSIEGVTHSICTLEFENNRELYDWILAHVEVPQPPPHQYEFARLNLTYTVLSKRKLLELVTGRHVAGWDDPRMPTLSGLRRRGYTAAGIRAFCETVGVAKNNSTVEVELLESHIRDDLTRRAPRVLCVLDPLAVEIVGPGADHETADAPYFPPDVETPLWAGAASRPLRRGRKLFVEREDFSAEPEPGWHRLALGAVVRLRHSSVVRCDEVVRDERGEVQLLRCSLVDPATVKPRGTLHWVDADTSREVEVRLYDRLFVEEHPERGDADYKTHLNPSSLVVCTARIEAAATDFAAGTHVQFERHGYFVADLVDSRPGAPVWNRTVALKDSWSRRAQPAPSRPVRDEPRPAVVARVELTAEARALRDAHGLSDDEAHVLCDRPALLALFTDATGRGAAGKTVATLLVHDLRPLAAPDLAGSRFDGAALFELAALLAEGSVTPRVARELLPTLIAEGGSPRALVSERGLASLDGASSLDPIIDATLAAHADIVSRYRAGEAKLFGVLMGEVMKASQGRADAKVASALLRSKLA